MKKILVPIDGSKASQIAAQKAAEFAKVLGSEITFLTVVCIPTEDKYNHFGLNVENAMRANIKEMTKHLIEQETKMLKIIVRNLELDGIKFEQKVLPGIKAAEIIIKTAKDGNYDLIVMGRRGFSTIERFFIGSSTRFVLSDSPCPVLVVNDKDS